jgi:two-component system sensor histidine kinase FlrB
MINEVEQKRLEELEEAFELFNQTSTQLTRAYESLQHEVIELKQKLAQSNKEKHRVGERLDQLLALLPAAVLVLDEQDRITDMNPAAAKILGKDAMGRQWSVVVRNAFLTHNAASELITHDQTIYQLSETSLNLSQTDHSLKGKILLIQDVTDARTLRDHISRHQRLSSMGEMAASLAHQIRTPLASALLYVSQMSSKALSEEKRDKFTSKTLSSLRHLEALVEDMLQYARGGKAKDQPVDVSQLLTQLAASVEPKVFQTRSVIAYDEVKPGLMVMGDQDALLTALQNLVSNSIDVVGEHADIQVRVTTSEPFPQEDSSVNISVKDQGPGLTETLHEKIFEPFFTSRAKGTGLGLAVVRAVAQAHDGDVWVHSIPGQGAEFGLRLPLAVEKEQA